MRVGKAASMISLVTGMSAITSTSTIMPLACRYMRRTVLSG